MKDIKQCMVTNPSLHDSIIAHRDIDFEIDVSVASKLKTFTDGFLNAYRSNEFVQNFWRVGQIFLSSLNQLELAVGDAQCGGKKYCRRRTLHSVQ